MGDFKFDAARGIGFDQVDEAPRDGAWRNFLHQEMESGAGRETTQQATDSAAGAYVNGMNPQHCVGDPSFLCGLDFEIDVIDADDLASVDVDDLLVGEIALEKKQAFGAVGGGPV